MPRRSALARDKETAQAVKLTLQGMGQCEIAETLGVSQTTVSNDLKHARQLWASSMVGDIEHVKADELERLTYVQIEAARAWERSKRDPANPANPKFLDVIVKAALRKSKMLGLDSATTRYDPVEYDPNVLTLRLEKYAATLSIPAITSAPAQDD